MFIDRKAKKTMYVVVYVHMSVPPLTAEPFAKCSKEQ